MSAEQLRNETRLVFSRQVEIINDDAKLFSSTSNPKVFFSRLESYIQRCEYLLKLSEFVNLESSNISENLERVKSSRDQITRDFIDRMWSKTCLESSSKKTEKGQKSCFQRFFDELSKYEEQMSEDCIEYYKLQTRDKREVSQISTDTNPNSMNRNKIPAEEIERMQRIEASEQYKQQIYQMFYQGYPEMPYISQDRELNTNWIEQACTFPNSSIIEKKMMKRFSDGLLPGHIYMLYWIENINRKRIPSYFEYEYGIDFIKEKEYLINSGYLCSNGELTELGRQAIVKHKSVIDSRHPSPRHVGSSEVPSPKQEKVQRIISHHEKDTKESIPAGDIDLILSEISYLNDMVKHACKLSKISLRLGINSSKISFDSSYYNCTPYTPSGKTSKYPLTLHLVCEKSLQNETFGEISYLQDGSIGKARLVFWRQNTGYVLYFGQTKNSLVVKKVEKINPPNKVVLYKE